MSNIIKRSFERMLEDEQIPNELYNKYSVKKGLRNDDGTGVLVGLTRISDVVGYQKDEEGHVKPCMGRLYYRGIEVSDYLAHSQANDIGEK